LPDIIRHSSLPSRSASEYYADISKSDLPRVRAKEYEQAKETLHGAATAAFQNFQGDIALEYEGLRNVAVKLATFDCLLSFAVVAAGEGYSRPEYVPDSQVRIKGGRHPMVSTFNLVQLILRRSL
jgi:DNA mismatch repair ATPase MutS